MVAPRFGDASLGKLAIWRAAARVTARSPVTLREACEARSATTPPRRRNLQEHQQRLPSPASVPTVWRFRARNASSRLARRQTAEGRTAIHRLWKSVCTRCDSALWACGTNLLVTVLAAQTCGNLSIAGVIRPTRRRTSSLDRRRRYGEAIDQPPSRLEAEPAHGVL